MTEDRPRDRVPWRTIWGAIGSVLLTIAVIWLLGQLQRVLVWIVISLFLAVVLNPPVDFFVARAHLRRGLAIGLVYLLSVLLVAVLGFVLFRPAVTEGQQLIDDAPHYVDDLEAGRGPLGGVVTRFGLQDRVVELEQRVGESAGELSGRTLDILGTVGNTVAGTLTVLVLTFLLLLDAPRILARLDSLVAEPRRDRVRKVAADCSKAVTGYMAGNLLISGIAGVSAAASLWIAGVGYAGTLGVFVAVTDLIPLVGATIGAVVVVAIAFFHSPGAGVAMIVFFVVYQQIENHVLQPAIQSRTVKLSPLTVLVSVLLGAELAGLLGALLAIPVAGVIRVLVRDLWDHRRAAGGPTVGEDRVPVDQAGPLDGFIDLRGDEPIERDGHRGDRAPPSGSETQDHVGSTAEPSSPETAPPSTEELGGSASR